jgi:hydroxypyruvate reductase
LSDPTVPPARDLLVELYTAAINAAAPGPALSPRLQQLDLDRERRIWILALGKAAMPMAATAVESLARGRNSPTGGLVVAPEGDKSPHPRLELVLGDHPEPGPRSYAAAQAVADVSSRVATTDEVWVLLSGGTTSLIGAPESGLTPGDLSNIYALLLGSGLDITAMNRVRKRFSRWGGGKLAQALYPALVRVFIVSDVIGDDLASIGSGPCVPDPSSASEVRLLLERAGLWSRIPEAGRRLIVATESGKTAETPKPGDQAFARVTLELIASNRLALEAAAKRAAELGLAPDVLETPLAGEAATAGASVADLLLNNCVQLRIPQPSGAPRCLIWGGETTVSLGESPTGLGGRSQELALAAARGLAGTPGGTALLAAGTDGRDGPTDAAGAVVDGKTWHAIVAAGRDPAHDLARHNAYAALDSVGALLKPGLTGTNVMDIVIGVCGLTA